ncbi:Hypothetical predicted protein [Cloeon dipterum]|uniref:Uncharacterized protein n=1 Tax=Cloeon dipterum TaxID=197152 RepID=A0A8S1DDV5_9INSE|nr:Hypothetical predicted protein [Cloeon dipterum]
MREEKLNLETRGVDCSPGGTIQDARPSSSTPAENSAKNSALQDDVLQSLADQANDVAKERLECKAQILKIVTDIEKAKKRNDKKYKEKVQDAKKSVCEIIDKMAELGKKLED